MSEAKTTRDDRHAAATILFRYTDSHYSIKRWVDGGEFSFSTAYTRQAEECAIAIAIARASGREQGIAEALSAIDSVERFDSTESWDCKLSVVADTVRGLIGTAKDSP